MTDPKTYNGDLTEKKLTEGGFYLEVGGGKKT